MDDHAIHVPAFQVVGPPASAGLVRRVAKVLSDYRIPRNVTEKTGISSLDDIKEQWLIVVCTPDTPSDPETGRAIDAFLLAGKRNRILTLLAEGTPERSFPESLVRETLPDGTVKEHEPLAANITAENSRRSLRRLNVERFRLLAPMLGVSFDDLMNRSLRRRRNILLTSGTLVLVGAIIFLCFAMTRMRTIRGQNEQLKKEYENAEEARKQAEAERDAAGEALARTVALSAGSLLEEGDTELSLLLCLEFLPGMKHISELTDVFEKALSVRCKAGFSSVTASRAYERTRDFDTAAYTKRRWEIVDAGKTERPEELSGYIEVPLPDGRKDAPYMGDHASPKFSDWSEEYGTAVYQSELPYGSPGNIAGRHTCLWICRSPEPEQGFWLREKDGTLITGISSAKILYDGSVLAAGDTFLRRFAFPEQDKNTSGESTEEAAFPEDNALAGFMEEIPVYDGETALREEIPFPITFYMDRLGFSDRIHGLAKHGVAVFEKSPFRLLYLIRDENTEVATTAPDGSTYWNGVLLATLPSGERRIVIGERYVYDEKDGSFLFEIEDHGQSTPYVFLFQSSEGWLPLWLGGELVFTDLADGHTVGMIRSPSGNRHTLYGPTDSLGNAGASPVLVYMDYDRRSNPSRYYWEYREKEIPVPEDLDGQIALAKELLNGRELIPAERRKYHLELK